MRQKIWRNKRREVRKRDIEREAKIFGVKEVK